MKTFTEIVLFLFAFTELATSLPCAVKSVSTGIVCVCNATYCDTLDAKLPVKAGEVLILSTSKSGLRYRTAHGKFNEKKISIPHGEFYYGSSGESQSPYMKKFMTLVKKVDGLSDPIDNVVNVALDRNEKFQKIIGFGGAFTGAVSYNLKQLSKEVQDHVYQSYYSKDIGLGYNMMRIPIGGCDFDLAPWTYNEHPEHDPYLTNFTHLDERDLDKIQQIHELMKVTKNRDIKIFGAAWSPPKWMKSNGEYSGMSCLREEYYQTWADYHVKYLELMAKNNLPFWAISTGNEPLNWMFATFMSLGWDPLLQGKWVAENLGPSMRKSAITKNVKILAGDDQRYTFPVYFERLYKGSANITEYIDGLAVHWYSDRFAPSDLLDETANAFPDKFIIATEACSGSQPWEVRKPVLGMWSRLEEYTMDIIEDLNHYVSAWVDWNLILDEDGGPNYAGNYVDAPIVSNGKEIYKQPMFYAMGHFSRFITTDSVRIKSKSSHRYIKSTSFIRPDGYTVIVLYNHADHNMDVNIFDKTHGVFRMEVPARSLHTLVYK